MYRIVLTVLLGCLAFSAPESRAAAAPNDVIEEAVELLSEGLNSRREELASDNDALYSFIDGILLPRFDSKFAASAVLGKHWRNASAEQKDRFVAAFYTTLLHRYADGLLEFDMDRVEILPYKGDTSKRTTEVKTRVQLGDGTKIPVQYTLVNRADQWRMFDVKIEGVSYVVNYRTELQSEIRSSSLESVIARLEADASAHPDE